MLTVRWRLFLFRSFLVTLTFYTQYLPYFCKPIDYLLHLLCINHSIKQNTIKESKKNLSLPLSLSLSMIVNLQLPICSFTSFCISHNPSLSIQRLLLFSRISFDFFLHLNRPFPFPLYI